MTCVSRRELDLPFNKVTPDISIGLSMATGKKTFVTTQVRVLAIRLRVLFLCYLDQIIFW